jgi:hypothetical protein
MNDLRERLRAGDPAAKMEPLAPQELAAMRQAMASARPEPRRWPIAAGLGLGAAALVVAAVVLWPHAPRPVPAPAPVAAVAPAPEVPVPPAPPAVVAQVRTPQRRRAVPPPPPAAEPAQVREIRFVTASGTQILWTVRSSEEGA